MLVLSRKEGEVVVIGGTDECPKIIVTVIKIQGDKVTLGFGAPKEIPIDRLEIHLQKQGNERKESDEENRGD